ncbi:hypothetical protein OB2597_05410 [Pseudooceanicola batsensis HTCC2597]|uniref:Uncharacterized protein n=1 Tax=Pseudooceanicola batsensis (strain ATCC BAA-863 / DSM 15984 / KCTC 12145 / HTCC2597) TaxID=252305 RepID=A3TSR7_PSEBH|nr:hypothetical protein OB2597_05410 [Pseudooceanicola batsensis HTCC2597]
MPSVLVKYCRANTATGGMFQNGRACGPCNGTPARRAERATLPRDRCSQAAPFGPVRAALAERQDRS